MRTAVRFDVLPEQENITVAAAVRAQLPGKSWNDVRKLITSRRVKIGADLCLDPARRLHAGDLIEVLPHSAPKPFEGEGVKIRYLDEHIVVVEKPTGMNSIRHPAERAWAERRRALLDVAGFGSATQANHVAYWLNLFTGRTWEEFQKAGSKALGSLRPSALNQIQ